MSDYYMNKLSEEQLNVLANIAQELKEAKEALQEMRSMMAREYDEKYGGKKK